LDENCLSKYRAKELKHLTDAQYMTARKFLYKFADVFDVPGRTFGCVVGVMYTADVRGPAVFQHPYALTPAQRKIVEDHLETLLKQGVIRPGQSEWSSPILLVPKKGGEWRVAVDYRRVNERMRNDVMPLPRID